MLLVSIALSALSLLSGGAGAAAAADAAPHPAPLHHLAHPAPLPSAPRAPHPAPLHDAVAAVQGLVSRVLGPAFLPAFTFSVLPPDAATGNDVFEIAPGASPISIAGSSGVALAAGLGWYLKFSANASWGWGFSNSGNNVGHLTPQALPPPATPGRFVSPARYHYSWNTCTFGYSFAFYTLQQWQEEVDRAALWGINAPLLPVGLEYAEADVYAGMGLTEAELQAWFTGHSHLPWQRMANIKALAGPLPAASRQQQAQLGAAISAMMTAYGMTPVLPGFAGHVPDALRRVHPAANITTSSDWGGVGCNYSCDALLEPTDPLFATLGAALNARVLQLYGGGVRAPMFNADTFNEESPESMALDYLAQWNSAVYGAMRSVSAAAIYVMQAWAFHGSEWTKERVQAYLAPVPLHSMLILDLNSEDGPVWQNYDGFFGHDWAWCGLIVFGGRRGVYGNLPVLASSIYAARNASSSLVGLGITPEAIDQCGAAFDMVLEAAWRPAPVCNVSDWLQAWAGRRYSAPGGGGAPPAIAAAYRILEAAAFHAGGPDLSIYEKTPSLAAAMSGGTNATGMLAAARLLLEAGESGAVEAASTTLAYDLLDLVRQSAAALHSDLCALAAARFLAAPPPGPNATAAIVAALAGATGASAALLRDLDALLASDANFMLGPWVAGARALGAGAGAEAHFVRDAQLLVTLWTPDGAAFGGQINDYSSRGGWAGLVGTYYAPRWRLFHGALLAAAAAGSQTIDGPAFAASLLALELAWVGNTSQGFPAAPAPGAPPPLAAARAFLDAWAPAAGPAPGAFVAHADSALALAPAPAPPSPPPPAPPPAWVFRGANLAATGEDCPFLREPPLRTLAACEAACVGGGGGCNFVNWDAAAPWCVHRACADPMRAQLSANPGYSAYAYNVSGAGGSGAVTVRARLRDAGAMASVCAADPLCTGFDSTGLIAEGRLQLVPAPGSTAYLRVV